MNLAATREALDRFVAELPAGLHADHVRRIADATRALADQALAQAGAPSAWADHNLAVAVAEGLSDNATREAAHTLFMGVRRRLAETLERDGDDLAAALALALGAAGATDDARTAGDVKAVASALSKPQVGPRLVAAAVELVVSASRADADEVKDAAAAAATTVREAADRVAARLPEHPGAALDRVRLALLEARASQGDERAAALGTVRGLLKDVEGRFGETPAAREILSGVLALEARSATPASDIRRDALALLEADVKGHATGPKRTSRLLRTIHRAGQLDQATASHITDLLGPVMDADDPRWFEARAVLYEASGDTGALLTLWQHTLEADPKSKHAARGLADRLVANLRQGLAAPFESAVLERVLDALPPAAAARWSADDLDRVLGLVTETFGASRTFAFVSDRLLKVRELRGRDAIWHRALALATELGEDGDQVVDVARAAVKHRGFPEARLTLARALVARHEHLGEAEAALKPLLEKKGPHAAEAQSLKARMKDDPAFKKARYETLLAYEHKLGVGTGKVFPLSVVFTTRSYALVELTEHPAPEGYEHKHLRTMVRAEDLPTGITPADLEKGDIVRAPLRGQDADPSRDRDGLRVYWIADRGQVRLDLDAAAVAARWSRDEEAFGVDSGKPVPLKVSWDKKKKRLVARLLKPHGGDEFRARPAINPERLPAGLEPDKIGGRGRRLWGLVARTDDGTKPGQRAYAIVSDLSGDAPEGAEGDGDDDGKKKGKRKDKGGAPDQKPTPKGGDAEPKGEQKPAQDPPSIAAAGADLLAAMGRGAEADAEPATKPAETDAKPAEADAEPAEADAEPAEADAEPAAADAKPAEVTP